VVAEASDGEEAVRLCGLHNRCRGMDMMIAGHGRVNGDPKDQGAESGYPGARSDQLSGGAFVRDALKAGRSATCSRLAIDSLLRPSVARAAGSLHYIARPPRRLFRARQLDRELVEELTERNGSSRTVVQGRSNQEIARQLYLGLSTVRFHVSAILAKLGAANRAEAAAMAVRYNCLTEYTEVHTVSH